MLITCIVWYDDISYHIMTILYTWLLFVALSDVDQIRSACFFSMCSSRLDAVVAAMRCSLEGASPVCHPARSQNKAYVVHVDHVVKVEIHSLIPILKHLKTWQAYDMQQWKKSKQNHAQIDQKQAV